MKKKIATFCFFLVQTSILFSQEFELTPTGYFQNGGADVMVFSDMYPDGHEGGITLVMNSNRVAANGDIRYEATPVQWQPFPALY